MWVVTISPKWLRCTENKASHEIPQECSQPFGEVSSLLLKTRASDLKEMQVLRPLWWEWKPQAGMPGADHQPPQEHEPRQPSCRSTASLARSPGLSNLVSHACPRQPHWFSAQLSSCQRVKLKDSR